MLTWMTKPFEGLAGIELYNILWLRSEVFVVEQRILFNDMDFYDRKALHLMAFNIEGILLAYSRIFPQNTKYELMSIGRVAVHPKHRMNGLGLELMEKSVVKARESFGNEDILIGAQAHLEHFYNKTGFFKTGQPYMEDTIPHIYMLNKAKI